MEHYFASLSFIAVPPLPIIAQEGIAVCPLRYGRDFHQVEAKKATGSIERTVAMVIIRLNDGLAIPHSMLPIVPVATSHTSANRVWEKPFL